MMLTKGKRMSIFRGIRSTDSVEVIINDNLPKKVSLVFPKWPFTIFEEKDVCWLSALGFMERKEEDVAYWINIPDVLGKSKPKVLISTNLYELLKVHFKEADSGEQLKNA